jgi:type 1 fimbria pilin
MSMPNVSLKFQSISNSTSMISKSWHLFNKNDLATCRQVTSGGEERIALLNVYGEKYGNYVFEGETYNLIGTNIDNVAVILAVGTSVDRYKPFYGSYETSFSSFSYSNASERKTLNVVFRYRFVALGKIAPGAFKVGTMSGALLVRSYETLMSDNLVWFTVSPSSNLSVNNASCKLTVPASVSLRRTTMALIPTVGSTQDGATFKMSVSCPAAYASYKVLYAMTDVNTPANTSDRLSLAPIAGSAKGIALQLLDGDTPIKFAPESSLTAPTTSFGTMGTAGGSLVKQLTARYIRTAPAATPGLLKANASIVLSYD